MEHREHTGEADILAALTRYIDQYNWSWNMARRLINRYFGTKYTESDLKKLYRRHQAGQSS